MTPDEKKFREHLAHHGADIASWPEELQAFARRAQIHPDCAALLEAEKRFERLLGARRLEPAHSSLAERIIIAAAKPAKVDYQEWMWDKLSSINPATLAAMLVIGFVIGFGALPSLIHSGPITALQASSDDDGAML